MAVSKRTRFEVLRRDNFTCRYCRSKENELRVDHVTPVALGGSDKPDNLVAACQDCNAGKSSASLDSETIAALTDAEIAYEKARATVVAREAKKAKAKRKVYEQFRAAWAREAPYADLAPDWRSTVEHWLSRGLTIDRIVEAVEIAGGKTHIPDRALYAYMCKIAWNWVGDLEDAVKAELAATEPQMSAKEIEMEGWHQGYADAHDRYMGEILGGAILRLHIDGMGERVPKAYQYVSEVAA